MGYHWIACARLWKPSFEVADGVCLYRADDLIPEESETVQLALKRLPPKEAYDRVYRLRRAFQVRLVSKPDHTTMLTVV